MFHKWTISHAVVKKTPNFFVNGSTFVKSYQKTMLNKKKFHNKRFSLKYKISN